MIGIVIVGIIFISAVSAVPTIGYVNLLQVNQQQLRNTALNVFNAMLLGTGSPSDWGSSFPFNESNVDSFGLAYSRESSLYVLDTDKVQRLDQESPGYMTYSRVCELLRLEDYGFHLTIFRPFTVNHNLSILGEETPKQVWFAVNVTRMEDGRPIPNAEVKCTIMVTAEKLKLEPVAIITSPKTYFTDLLGHCEASEPIDVPEGYTLTDALAVLEISVASMSTVVVARENQAIQNFVKIYTFGDTISLKMRDEFEDMAPGEKRVEDISSYNEGELMQIFDGSDMLPPDLKITPGEGYVTWSASFPGLRATNPLLLLYTLRVKNPNRFIMIAGPLSLGEASRVFSFGPDSESFNDVATKLRRYIVISGMIYIAELTLWRE